MSLKNVLIIVDNIDESIDFYEELFGLRMITRQEGNVIMSEGLVLQDVDADACSVVDIVETIAEKYNISTTLLCDTNHILYSDYSEVIVVGAGADAVDYKLISICHKGDVVVSQDYGVAAMALGNGLTRSGGHRFCTDRSGNGDPRKCTEDDDVRFAQSFEKLILMARSKEGAQSGNI